MSTYNKKTWVTGETIYADDLNHMEQGIADGNNILIVETLLSQDESSIELSKNYAEIVDYFTRGLVLVIDHNSESSEGYSSDEYTSFFVVYCEHQSTTSGDDTINTYIVTVADLFNPGETVNYESDSDTGALRLNIGPN